MEPHLQNCDAVIHLAALVGYPLCKNADLPKVNLMEHKHVDLTSSQDRLVYASTGSNMEKLLVFAQKIFPNPLSLYGRIKTGRRDLFRRNDNVSLRFATAFGTDLDYAWT